MLNLYRAVSEQVLTTPLVELPPPSTDIEQRRLHHAARSFLGWVGVVSTGWVGAGALVLHHLSTGLANGTVAPGAMLTAIVADVLGSLLLGTLFFMGLKALYQVQPLDRVDAERLLGLCQAFPQVEAYRQQVRSLNRPFRRQDLNLVLRHQPFNDPNACARLYRADALAGHA